MFKNVKLGTRILCGFGSLLILLALTSYVGFQGLRAVAEKSETAGKLDNLIQLILESRRYEKNFMLRGEASDVSLVQETGISFRSKAEDIRQHLKLEKDRLEISKALEEFNKYLHAFNLLVEAKKIQDHALGEMRTRAETARAQTEAIISDQKEQYLEAKRTAGTDVVRAMDDRVGKMQDAGILLQLFLDAEKKEKEFIAGWDSVSRNAVQERVARILALSKDLRSRFKREVNIVQIDEVTAAIQAYAQSFEKLSTVADQRKTADRNMVETARAAQEICRKTCDEQLRVMHDRIKKERTIIVAGSLFSIALGLFLSILITRLITRPLTSVISGLWAGAEQVASASVQISQTSQQLAEGASQQAASIEETSASLEEMSSMTKQNADNAVQANTLMAETREAVEKASLSMSRLTESMSDISSASAQVSEIIRTIDAIAFQTNLLALNAAVEAARAGEAGAGFAVVADEVRNLAMRAAEAARDTSGLIEGTVRKIGEGSDIVSMTGAEFSQLALSAEKMGELVAEIAAASNEQAQGIEQVNTAVGQMDKVVQLNASNAEESAAASEEMSAQAEQMRGFVDQLALLIGGGNRSAA
jgi:methyl-accepting chemotaxis protein